MVFFGLLLFARRVSMDHISFIVPLVPEVDTLLEWIRSISLHPQEA